MSTFKQWGGQEGWSGWVNTSTTGQAPRIVGTDLKLPFALSGILRFEPHIFLSPVLDTERDGSLFRATGVLADPSDIGLFKKGRYPQARMSD